MTWRRPDAEGAIRRGPDLTSTGSGGGIKPLPAERRQPRLAGCVTCLTAIFEDCALCAAIFLRAR